MPNYLKHLWSYLLCFVLFWTSSESRTGWSSVLQTLREDPNLSTFYFLLEGDSAARATLQYTDLTVFAPTNEAFEYYEGKNIEEIVFYHMVWHVKKTNELETTFLATIADENPPLWVTRNDNEIYVNNARVVPSFSDYLAEIPNDRSGKKQILHVIDEVLDPVAKRAPLAIFNPSAYDFLTKTRFWDVAYRVSLFQKKLQELHQENVLKDSGSHTFFVPIDEGFTDYRFQMMDSDAVLAHIVPNSVLFTRPAPKDFPLETLSSGDYLYVVLTFVERDGSIFVRSNTLVGDVGHPVGEVLAEIVKANIPVKNGVVHLINRPLVVFDRRLTLFPYLPIIDKIAADPLVDISYSLGKECQINEVLSDEKRTFTYFVPTNEAWSRVAAQIPNKNYLKKALKKNARRLMGRHLVESEVVFTIEKLKTLSHVVENTKVRLSTASDAIDISVSEINGTFFIHWKNLIFPVYRPNYSCTNGIVHLIDGVFLLQEDLYLDKEIGALNLYYLAQAPLRL